MYYSLIPQNTMRQIFKITHTTDQEELLRPRRYGKCVSVSLFVKWE